MSSVSTKAVSELRARTGAGIGDCKNALEEAGGDMEKAAEILRKKGIAKAEKRAGRSASQGLVLIEPAGHGAGMIEVNCETDFVARNEDFQAFATKLAQHVAHAFPVGLNAFAPEGALLEQPYEGTTLGEVVKAQSAKTGELVSVKRTARFAPDGGVVGQYLHHNRQVGVIVEVAGSTGPEALDLAKDVALHVASADPLAVNASDIPAEFIERERRIAEEQVAAEGKPENIRAKIVEGKVKKFVAERTLLEQPFVKDENKLVGQLVAEASKAAGAALTVVRFARFKVGEA